MATTPDSPVAQVPSAPVPAADGRSAGRLTNLLATIGTDVFGPVTVVPVLCLAVGWHAGVRHLTGLGFGLLLAMFTTVVPFAIVLWQVRRGRVTDHYIGRREQRRNPMLIASVSTAAVTAAIWALDAPRALVTTGLSILVAGLVATVVNALWWKMSVHASTAAGATVVAVAVFGPLALLAIPAVAVNGWSRVFRRAHTVAQVITGALTGALVTGLVVATAGW